MRIRGRMHHSACLCAFSLTNLPRDSRRSSKVFEQILVPCSHLVDHRNGVWVGFVVLHPAAIHELDLTARDQRLE